MDPNELFKIIIDEVGAEVFAAGFILAFLASCAALTLLAWRIAMMK